MQIKITGHVKAKGDCGHEIDVPVDRLDDEFECPVCGAKDRFGPEQLAGIKTQLTKQAGEFGVEQMRQQIGDAFAKSASRSKHVTYRPDRR